MHRGRARRRGRGRFQISEFSFKHVGRSQLLGNTPQHHRFSGLDCSRFADDERSEPKPVAEPQPNTAVQKLTLVRLRSLGLEPLRGRIESISAKKPWCTVSRMMVTSLRSKWAAGKGSVSAGRRIGVSASQETRFRNVWHGRDALPCLGRKHRLHSFGYIVYTLPWGGKLG